MSRIDEIKERLKEFQTAPREGVAKGLPWDTIQVIGQFSDNAPSDIQFLLSKLEAAEKSLKKVSEQLEDIDHSARWDDSETTYELVGEASVGVKEALNDIRS